MPLYGNPELQQLARDAQDDERLFGILEDLREVISDYQVCS